MAQVDWNKFLATRVVLNQQPITYNLLARELRINPKLAKQCLYSFHRASKSNYSGKVHATFVLVGFKRVLSPGDVDMTSTSLPSSQPSTELNSSQDMQHTDEDGRRNSVLCTYVQLVQEEDLEAAKLMFDRLISIYVYSIEPAKLSPDLIELLYCDNQVRDLDVAGGLKLFGSYGSILNSMAVERTSPLMAINVNNSPRSTLTSTEKAVSIQTTKRENNFFAAKSSSKPAEKSIDKQSEHKLPSSSNQSRNESWPEIKKETVKKENFGGIQPEKVIVKPAIKIDDKLRGMFDDMEDEDSILPDQDQDLEMEDAQANEISINEPENTADIEEFSRAPENADVEEVLPQDQVAQNISATFNTESSVEKSAQRRGRRQVTKRVRTKDEKGFVRYQHITEWESCSEGEFDLTPAGTSHITTPAAPASKEVIRKPSEENSSSSDRETAQPKGATKKGKIDNRQSSIMSFSRKR
ncbi:DNA polymerase subunit Cdc27 [Lipomyces oligophaga]|uniref:DNA polymerase subunit Cdc27 n=1 Tax=Lipomyces oligophaga TaxID=45792 RepID=UPI0034CD1807